MKPGPLWERLFWNRRSVSGDRCNSRRGRRVCPKRSVHGESDEEMKAFLKSELEENEAKIPEYEEKMKVLLLPSVWVFLGLKKPLQEGKKQIEMPCLQMENLCLMIFVIQAIIILKK